MSRFREVDAQPPAIIEPRGLFVDQLQQDLNGLSTEAWRLPNVELEEHKLAFMVPLFTVMAVHKEAARHPGITASSTIPPASLRESYGDLLAVLRGLKPDERRPLIATHMHEALDTTAYREIALLRGFFGLAANNRLPILGKNKSSLLVNGVLQEAIATQGLAIYRNENAQDPLTITKPHTGQAARFPHPRQRVVRPTPGNSRPAKVL